MQVRPVDRFRRELELHPTSLESLQELLPLAECPLSKYMLLSMLTHFLRRNPSTEIAFDLQPFVTKLSRSMSATQLWSLLQLAIWRHEGISAEHKRVCRYYELLSHWVLAYEEVISRAENEARCFLVIEEFVKRTTLNYFERVILVEESFDDIKAVVKYRGFWEETEDNLAAELYETPTHDNYEALLRLMQLIVYRSDVNTDALGVHSNQLYDVLRDCNHYQQFVYCSLKYLMRSQKLMHQHEMDLTKLALRYAAFTTSKEYLMTVVAMALSRSSKAVKFACMSQYQSLAAVLESHNRSEFEEQLESLHDFREMTLKRIEITELESEDVLHQHHDTTVMRGQLRTFYFEVTRPSSLLMLQLHLETNINLVVAFEGNAWSQERVVYLNENRCTSHSFHIKINDCGLHSITLDNTFSWINNKRVRWHALVYRPVLGDTDSFGLLLDPEEYVPWRGYNANEVVSQQQNLYHNLWKRYLPIAVDVMFRGGKVYHRGQVSDVSTFQQRSESLGKVRTYVVEDASEHYERWMEYIKERNPQCERIPSIHS